jgi:hypothetical protein
VKRETGVAPHFQINEFYKTITGNKSGLGAAKVSARSGNEGAGFIRLEEAARLEFVTKRFNGELADGSTIEASPLSSRICIRTARAGQCAAFASAIAAAMSRATMATPP